MRNLLVLLFLVYTLKACIANDYYNYGDCIEDVNYGGRHYIIGGVYPEKKSYILIEVLKEGYINQINAYDTRIVAYTSKIVSFSDFEKKIYKRIDNCKDWEYKTQFFDEDYARLIDRMNR